MEIETERALNPFSGFRSFKRKHVDCFGSFLFHECGLLATLFEVDDEAKTSASMTLIEDSFWTLRIDSTRPIRLTPEEPQDFMYEVCGKILCGTEEDYKDRIAGRFRVYYADFETAQNHGVSAFEAIDTYHHASEFAEAILGSSEAPFSARLQSCLGMRFGTLIS